MNPIATHGAKPGKSTPGNEVAARSLTAATSAGSEQRDSAGADLALTITAKEPRIDSRLLALNLGIKHQSMFELIKAHHADFEELGLLRFQTGERTGGRPERFAQLNEDQAYLVLTYSRNTVRVRELKVRMVKAFRAARHAAEIRLVEYSPAYHNFHDAIKRRAGGSPNARWMHSNANRELNRIAGVQPGQRGKAGPLQQSLLTLACVVGAKAVENAPEAIKVHECIKSALKPLEELLALPGQQESA